MKKTVLLILCILMVAVGTVLATAYEGENYILFSDTSSAEIPINQHIAGDSNGDGTVNLLDALAIFKYISGNKESSLRDSIDTNSDGAVALADALLIVRHVLGASVGLGELVG